MDLKKNIASFLFKKNMFGISIFSYESKEFMITADFPDTLDCESLKSIIYKLDVDLILISLDLDNTRYEILRNTEIELLLIERNLFRDKRMDLSTAPNINISLYCLNALLNYLNQTYNEFFDIQNKKIFPVLVNDIAYEDVLKKIGKINDLPIFLINLNVHMNLDTETIVSLNLISFKKHPNPAMKTKSQNDSLYKILDNCQTISGSKRLKMWVMFPLKIDVEIKSRQNSIEIILKDDLMPKLVGLLKKCKCLENNERNYFNENAKTYFYNICTSLISGMEIMKYFSNDIDKKILEHIVYEINDKIEFCTVNSFVIKKGADNELDNLKSLYEKLPSYLDEVAKRVSREYKIETSIIYYPQLGYLIETIEDIKDLEIKFSFDKKKYFKNNFMNSLDLSMGDIVGKINDTEKEITMKIKLLIDQQNDEIMKLYRFIERIDCLNSLAIAAKKYNMKKPEILKTVENEIQVIDFHNIVYETKFINYKTSCININKCSLVSGPNSCGKSTFIRGLGVAVVLNQIGSFLPCKSAKISIFDNIFTKIIPRESISGRKSAFLSDVLQISKVFKFSTNNSLFLCDEFGKGTNILDGVSIFFSVLFNLKHPLCVYVSHYTSFVEFLGQYENLNNINFITFKDYMISEGINDHSKVVDLLHEFDFDKEFIDSVKLHKKIIEDNEKIHNKERDDSWAIKIINDFFNEN